MKIKNLLIASLVLFSISILLPYIVSLCLPGKLSDYGNLIMLATSLLFLLSSMMLALTGTILYLKNTSGFSFGAIKQSWHSLQPMVLARKRTTIGIVILIFLFTMKISDIDPSKLLF
jgi:hypothetical protein